MTAITYIGDFSQSGAAYPVINNALSAALERQGVSVSRNLHNDASGAITPIAIAHEYPPRKLNMRHDLNICLAAWEFATPQGVPRPQVEVFNTFDAVFVPSQWVAEQLAPALDVPVRVIRWGVDTSVFYPMEDMKFNGSPETWVNMLWLGGTDPRHGFDIALQVLDRLPDNYLLKAKQSAHYPAVGAKHPRLSILRVDLTQAELARLYNCHDIFLQTARGVGFSLPTLEALACGLQVVSTPLPPIQEIAEFAATFSDGGTWEPMLHHLYGDCWPVWYEPDVDSLVDAVLRANDARVLEFDVDYYSWDNAAKVLLEQIESLL
jgi:glycosyltransferase involved in cell wall biosynthesis